MNPLCQGPRGLASDDSAVACSSPAEQATAFQPHLSLLASQTSLGLARPESPRSTPEPPPPPPPTHSPETTAIATDGREHWRARSGCRRRERVGRPPRRCPA